MFTPIGKAAMCRDVTPTACDRLVMSGGRRPGREIRGSEFFGGAASSRRPGKRRAARPSRPGRMCRWGKEMPLFVPYQPNLEGEGPEALRFVRESCCIVPESGRVVAREPWLRTAVFGVPAYALGSLYSDYQRHVHANRNGTGVQGIVGSLRTSSWIWKHMRYNFLNDRTESCCTWSRPWSWISGLLRQEEKAPPSL